MQIILVEKFKAKNKATKVLQVLKKQSSDFNHL